MEFLQCREFRLSLKKPLIMGIINVTPDSFSDGSLYNSPQKAYEHAVLLQQAGADILDIGAESTRPGSDEVPVEVELERVLPVIRGVKSLGLPISLDTKKPEVMLAGLQEGVHLINDVNGFRADGALDVMAKYPDAGVCIMHMKGQPKDMQNHLDPNQDMVKEVNDFLLQRAQVMESIGFQKNQIILDPGFGFGKTLDQNYALLNALVKLSGLGYPVLAGLSRKGMLGAVLDCPPGPQRDVGTVVASLACIQKGAHIVRVHNVRAMNDAIKIAHKIEQVALQMGVL